MKSEKEKGIITLFTIAIAMVALLCLSVITVGAAHASEVDDGTLYAKCYIYATIAEDYDQQQTYLHVLKPYLKKYDADIVYATGWAEGLVVGVSVVKGISPKEVAVILLPQLCNQEI